MRALVLLVILSSLLGAATTAVADGGASPVVFTDVTATALAGIETEPGLEGSPPVFTGGAAVGDCDGDGLPDLFLTGVNHCVLYRNRGDGMFEDITVRANLGGAGPTRGAAFADIDHDGDLDLFVSGDQDHFLYVNDGTCRFSEEGGGRGVAAAHGSPWTVSFGDYDRDGYLDLYVAEQRSDFRDTGASVPRPSGRLFRNRGAAQPGYFDDVTTAAGVSLEGVPATEAGTFAYTARFADLDGDGWPDLAIAADFGQSRLFWNDHDGHFTDGTVAAGVGTDEFGMGMTTGDLDGDGRPDLFVSSIFAVGGIKGNGNRLYRNLGDRLFADVTDAAGVRDGNWGWGVEAFDFDNDGDLDLLLNNGRVIDENDELTLRELGDTIDVTQFAPGRPRLWRNDGGVFTDVAAAAGAVDAELGQGVLPFDYDGDGDLDVLLTHDCCGPGPPRLLRNDGGNANHWLDVELEGRAASPHGVGALVTVTPVAGAPMVREVSASSTYLAQDGTGRLHFGLGPGAPAVASVHVQWPSGLDQMVSAPPIDTVQHVTEPASAQTKRQSDCIVALNRAGAKLATKVGARLIRCVRRATLGTLPLGQTAEECLTADPHGSIAAAQAATSAAAARTCAATPSFGPPSAAAVNAALGGVLRVHDLFGPNLDAALVDARNDAAGAMCQMAVARGIVRIATAELKAFDDCKAAGLASDTIRSGTDLRACTAAMSGPAVARAVTRAERNATSRCAVTDLAAAFPGQCAGATPGALFACLEPQVQCGICLALNAADRLASSCHRFQDGVATLYCGDRPVTSQSTARQWDEELLSAIRLDTPRPTVHARNLFHLSVTMWDAWRAYGGGGSAWLTDESHPSDDPDRDRAIAISFAAYRLLSARFQTGPGAVATQASLRARMVALGLDPDFTATAGDLPAAVGNRIGSAMLAWGLTDGSNEQGNYLDATYVPVNDPMIVKQPGTTLRDPNRWQPLALDQIITQNGIPLPGKVQSAIGMRWNQVTPFALTRSDPNALYIDPGPPPQLGGATDAAYKESARRLIELSSWLDPADAATIDASPGAIGNNPLGTNDGLGYPLNPVTAQPYAPNLVRRADWLRVLAEFWADGPNSETPPGHWNVIANQVSDVLPAWRIGGDGPALGRLEWDVKLYVAVNGAVHDAAIVAWGIKRRYDSVRPISMIRYLAGRGQSSDPDGPSYAPDGIVLEPGLVEVVTAETTVPGGRHEALAGHEGEIAIRAYAGPPADPTAPPAGVHWIRGVEWMPYQKPTFVTPAFASYTSGHSTFSRAAAEVLTRFTGSPFVPGGLGEVRAPANASLTFERGPSTDVLMQWATYYDAADLAGQSRLAGGIHVTADDFAGRISGSQVGIGAFARAMTLFGAGAP